MKICTTLESIGNQVNSMLRPNVVLVVNQLHIYATYKENIELKLLLGTNNMKV